MRSAYATFTVQARDRFGNECLQGGDTISVLAVPNTTEYNFVHTKPGHVAPTYTWDNNAVVYDQVCISNDEIDIQMMNFVFQMMDYGQGTGKYNVSWPIATFADSTWPVDSVWYTVRSVFNGRILISCSES